MNPDKLTILAGVLLLLGYWFLVGWACYSALGGRPKRAIAAWALLGAALAGILFFAPILAFAVRELVCSLGQSAPPAFPVDCNSGFSLDREMIAVLIRNTFPILIVALLIWGAVALRLLVNQFSATRVQPDADRCSSSKE